MKGVLGVVETTPSEPPSETSNWVISITTRFPLNQVSFGIRSHCHDFFTSETFQSRRLSEVPRCCIGCCKVILQIGYKSFKGTCGANNNSGDTMILPSDCGAWTTKL